MRSMRQALSSFCAVASNVVRMSVPVIIIMNSIAYISQRYLHCDDRGHTLQLVGAKSNYKLVCGTPIPTLFSEGHISASSKDLSSHNLNKNSQRARSTITKNLANQHPVHRKGY